jgi:acyl carrier protein
MGNDKIIENLEKVFKDVFKDNSLVIYKQMTTNDIEGWNSLTHMILITKVEKEFIIKFKLKELNKMRNVGDMIDLIQSKL